MEIFSDAATEAGIKFMVDDIVKSTLLPKLLTCLSHNR